LGASSDGPDLLNEAGRPAPPDPAPTVEQALTGAHSPGPPWLRRPWVLTGCARRPPAGCPAAGAAPSPAAAAGRSSTPRAAARVPRPAGCCRASSGPTPFPPLDWLLKRGGVRRRAQHETAPTDTAERRVVRRPDQLRHSDRLAGGAGQVARPGLLDQLASTLLERQLALLVLRGRLGAVLLQQLQRLAGEHGGQLGLVSSTRASGRLGGLESAGSFGASGQRRGKRENDLGRLALLVAVERVHELVARHQRGFGVGRQREAHAVRQALAGEHVPEQRDVGHHGDLVRDGQHDHVAG